MNILILYIIRKALSYLLRPGCRINSKQEKPFWVDAMRMNAKSQVFKELAFLHQSTTFQGAPMPGTTAFEKLITTKPVVFRNNLIAFATNFRLFLVFFQVNFTAFLVTKMIDKVIDILPLKKNPVVRVSIR